VKAEYRRLHIELAGPLSAIPDKELRNLNVAQNVLRDVLTALFEEMAPYGHLTVLELAARAASYTLSVAPMEDQDLLVSDHLSSFAVFHMERTARGAIIPSTWRMEDGRSQTNFPEGEAA
jgi:hypothetical protein